ncbi:MAG: hypothetical protein AB7F98_06340 [Novosphingobium sp.]
MIRKSHLLAAVAVVAVLGGCRSKGDIVIDGGVGITAIRSRCPAIGVPDYTGDITLFRLGSGRSADDIDVVAAITNVRSQCDDGGRNATGNVTASATFDVLARRTDVRGARQVVLPYYVSVLRGGTAVVSKRIGQVVINFADGQDRAQGRGAGSAVIDRAEATLPQDIRDRITRKRRAGEDDAAVDPLAEPEVKAAVARATFELLVGFQLDDAQLAYNVRR